ncbi:hypothetical protein PR048_014431 [Dryococelus australis]|uniref:Uncharacterized protein n=1 Tax=Dryococelus australis TaxID=614101 RepID=A0ABQ9HEC8_9NEOP|nr:hypothetical protein PR048_014431 [Dryococelus australis]
MQRYSLYNRYALLGLSLACHSKRSIDLPPVIISRLSAFVFRLSRGRGHGKRVHLIYTIQRHDGNTARLARMSDETLGVRVSVARLIQSVRCADTGNRHCSGPATEQGSGKWDSRTRAPIFSALGSSGTWSTSRTYSLIVHTALHTRISGHVIMSSLARPQEVGNDVTSGKGGGGEKNEGPATRGVSLSSGAMLRLRVFEPDRAPRQTRRRPLLLPVVANRPLVTCDTSIARDTILIKCCSCGINDVAMRSRSMRVIEVNMERRWTEGAGETGDPLENPPTNDIVRHDDPACEQRLMCKACPLPPSPQHIRPDYSFDFTPVWAGISLGFGRHKENLACWHFSATPQKRYKYRIEMARFLVGWSATWQKKKKKKLTGSTLANVIPTGYWSATPFCWRFDWSSHCTQLYLKLTDSTMCNMLCLCISSPAWITILKAPVYLELEVRCRVYTHHDENTARQFRTLRLAATGELDARGNVAFNAPSPLGFKRGKKALEHVLQFENELRTGGKQRAPQSFQFADTSRKGLNVIFCACVQHQLTICSHLFLIMRIL